MLKLKDKNKKIITGLTNYKDLCIESTLSTGDKKLSFSLHKKDKFYGFIEEECYIETKTQEYVIKARDVGVNYTRFDCVLNLEELEANVFDRFESLEQPITASLNLAIVGTCWTVKDNTLKKKRTVRCTNKNALEIVQEIKKTYRVDIVFNTLKKQIEVYEHLGEDKGTYFIDSLNLIALQIQSDSYKFATRIIAEGKDGLTFEDINNGKNYVENYQYSKKVKTLYWKDERYTIKESLLEDARAKLEEISKPFVSYNASILNLAELNPKYKNILDYQLGDTITLLSKNNKVKDKQRIVKTLEYPQDHSRDTVELANAVLKFEDIQQENQETTDTVNNITSDNGTLDSNAIEDNSIEIKKIDNFEANVLKVTKLDVINANIENLHANKADIQDLNAVKATVGQLEATKANITQLNATNAEISKLSALKADITDLNAANGKINVLESKTASIDNLVSQKASINDLKALNATISDALIKKATIAELEALETKTNKLIADKANIIDLNATNANINKIQAETANIKTLLNGNLSSENIQAGGITSDKLTIANGFITNLMISSVSASKITAGTIDAAKINVVNLNADNLTVGKINGQLLKDGSISGLAIENGAIDNNKVSPNANIEASKINISSVVTAINDGSTLLTANKVAIDSDKGTLDLAFKNLNTSLDANKKATESNSTAINVQQGQINASIENSKILEGKQKTLEDNYNRTVATVDSLKNTIGEQKTLIDSATGKITSVEVKANTLEKNLNGLTQTVTDTKKVIENNKTSLESKNAELKANIDKVSSSLSSVSNTVDKNNKALVSKTNTLEQTLSGLTQTVSSNKAAADGKITSVENVTHELKAGLSGLTSKLDTLKSSTDGINKTVINQGSAINQLQDSIKLKVDSSTFNKSTETINSSINKAKEDAVNAASTDATNKANNALNSAKTYVNAEITTVNSHLNKATSEINILKDKIESKVGTADVEKAIQNIKFGGRNLLRNTGLSYDSKFWLFDNGIGRSSNIDSNLAPNNHSIFIDISGVNQDEWRAANPEAVPCIAGEIFSASVLVMIPSNDNRLDDNLNCAALEIQFWDSTGRRLATETTTININTPKDKWYKIICENRVSPPNTVKVNARVWVRRNGRFWIGNIKLIKGNKIGDWSPAPEDTNQLIVESQNTVTEKIKIVESNLTQTKNSIEASVRDLDSQTKAITTNVTNINNDLINKINTAKGDAINKAKLDAKDYTNAQISTVNTKVHNVESNLNILKEKIESKVSQSDIDKSISNIQLGGRNYVRYSNFSSLVPATNNIKGWNVWGDISVFFNQGKPNYNVNGVVYLAAIKGGGIWQEISADLIKPNEDYTLSLLLGQEVNVRDCPCYIEFWNNDVKVKAIWLFGNTGYLDLKRRSYTFKTINEPYTSIRLVFVHNGSQNGNGCLLQVGLIKLEKGNKAGDWTIATEDTDSLIADNIKVVDTKISDVSSKITQLKDSVAIDINSINSKTHSIETSLGSKASKQEVTEVNNRVATIKASLDSITQRVSSTESKTQTLETNLNGKASKQEVVNITSRIATVETNLSGITSRVSSTETVTKSLNDKLWEATNKLNNVEQRITPTSIINTVSSSYYKKGEVDNVFSTKSEVEQLDNRINYKFSNTGYSNLIFNGNFANGTVHWRNWGNCSLVAENGQLTVRAKQSSNNANIGAVSSTFVLEKGKKYSLTFQGCSSWNIPWLNYIYLLGEDGVNHRLDLRIDINSADLVYRTATFTAPATKWVRLLIGVEGYLQTDISGFKLVDVCLVEGDIPRRFVPNANEISEGATSIDSNGVIVRHTNGSYTSMTLGGFAWKTKNMEKAYHCLAETGWVNISTGAWLGDHYDIKITLPEYFRGKVFTPCSMIQGWYVESNFSLNQLVVNIPYETINYSEGSFVIRVKALTRDGTFQRNINISWLAIA